MGDNGAARRARRAEDLHRDAGANQDKACRRVESHESASGTREAEDSEVAVNRRQGSPSRGEPKSQSHGQGDGNEAPSRAQGRQAGRASGAEVEAPFRAAEGEKEASKRRGG